MHIEHIEQYCYFFATAGLIETKLYGNHQFKKEISITLQACPNYSYDTCYGPEFFFHV
jgi:hypothetical protein